MDDWEEIAAKADDEPINHLRQQVADVEGYAAISRMHTYAFIALHEDGEFNFCFKGNTMSAIGALRVLEASLTADAVRKVEEG